MDKILDWIKTWGIIAGLILTLHYQSCATRREIKADFRTVETEIKGTNKRLDSLEKRLDRIEDKVERINQNYIDHLVHHNKD